MHTLMHSAATLRARGLGRRSSRHHAGRNDATRGDAGFTLIELLIVVTIVALLGGIMMFALAGARANALEKKTRTTIQRLHEALLARWVTYETRRISWQEGQGPSASTSPSDAAKMRLNALRELMRLELPQRWSDVESRPTTGIVQPAANRAYNRRLKEAKGRDGKSASDSPNKADLANAECLYMILTTRMGEEESIRDSIKDSEIGDVDGDGLFEFLDGWGNPICFLRWAPGFESDLQPPEARANARKKEYHDPFDPLMTDDRAFALFPLIYSAGRDQKWDIYHGGSAGERGSMNDPYSSMQVGQGKDEKGFGFVEDGYDNSHDNIHNHMSL
jgi:prepilin-type N-terminal cleavage/methylation domain-containing protein